MTRSRRTSGLLFSRRSSVGTWEALEAHGFTQCQVRPPPQCIRLHMQNYRWGPLSVNVPAWFWGSIEELVGTSLKALELLSHGVSHFACFRQGDPHRSRRTDTEGHAAREDPSWMWDSPYCSITAIKKLGERVTHFFFWAMLNLTP